MTHSMPKGLQCIVGAFRTVQPFRSFPVWERRMFIVFRAKKKDGLFVLASFNLCLKIKKVLNQTWQSSWCLIFSNKSYLLSTNKVVVLWGSKVDKRKRESFTGDQLDANTRFLVALATSEFEPCNGVLPLCGGQILTKLETETKSRGTLRARLLIATVFERINY